VGLCGGDLSSGGGVRGGGGLGGWGGGGEEGGPPGRGGGGGAAELRGEKLINSYVFIHSLPCYEFPKYRG